MAEPQPSSSRPPRSFSRALLVAGMVTVLFGALLVAVDGFLSLLTDRDVISQPDAGPLVGPVMAVVGLAVVFVSVLDGLRPPAGRIRIPVARAIGTGLIVYLLGPMAGATVYVFGQQQLMSWLVFFGGYLTSPFVIASAVLAAFTVLFLPLIASARSHAK